MLTVGAEILSLSEWSRRTDINIRVLWDRFVVKKWPPERVIEPTKSQGERARDKATCVHGHPRTPENLWLHDGKKHCRVCMRDRVRARRSRERVAKLYGQGPAAAQA